MMMVAAFAGIMLVADDVNAEDTGSSDESGTSSSWASDGKGDYSVTFAFDGGVIVKQMSTGNKYNFSGADAVSISGTVKAPAGYEFSAWKDSNSGVVYSGGSEYTFTQDIIVEPKFKVKSDISVIILTDGISTETFAVDGTVLAANTPGLSDFLKEIGLQLINTTVSISNDLKSSYVFNGFFKGEVPEDEKTGALSEVTALKGTEGAETIYVASFTPIYSVVYFVDETAVMTATSNGIKDGDSPTGIPIAPIRENYIFMGWYDVLGEKVIGYSVDSEKYTIVEGFEFTEDIALFAEFVPLTYTVTFVYGEDMEVFITETVKYNEKAIEPNGLPKGYKAWDFDFSQPITEDTVIVAVVAEPVTVYNVTFEIYGKDPMTVPSNNIPKAIDTARDGYVFQFWVVKGDPDMQAVNPWSYDYTADVTFVAVYDKAPAPAGPGFFQTTAGQCTAVIIAVLIIALVYAVYTNMFGMKDFLTSFKVQRVKK